MIFSKWFKDLFKDNGNKEKCKDCEHQEIDYCPENPIYSCNSCNCIKD